MYRTYLKTSLNKDKLKEINRNAAKNTKYCNGIVKILEKSMNSVEHVFIVINVETILI